MNAPLSTTALRQKLLFDADRERRRHVTIAIGLRTVAHKFPAHAPVCRKLMRRHALMARGKAGA